MIQVAIMGFGTVGSGVAEVLDKNRETIARGAGQELRLKYILDTREFPGSPYESLVVHEFETIEQDPQVRLVAECIGGVGVAYEFVKRCLEAGKHVVTSNKEMVAKKGQELLKLAEEHQVNFLFEASVGGGIPILRPLMTCFAANQIQEICGILNGTTNYILTRMIGEGAAFDDVLHDAQAMGYAERDPSADVEGHDACRKLCILSDLAFGRTVDPEQVPTRGITGISPEAVSFASKAKMRIKLLARVLRLEDGRIAAYVSPHFVPAKRQLAMVDGVYNAIMVRGNAVGETMFYGQGAGKLPTASAVAADLVDAANRLSTPRKLRWSDSQPDYVVDYRTLKLRWFVRAEDEEDAILSVLPDAQLYGTVEGTRGFRTPPMTLQALEQLGLHRIEQFPILD
ncbi:MAG: homoserine dehydrogenase [Oscillospiraceae bacterium]|nr:homoserine dehydrogenase [Oscillospiraceae bacterium]